jgi:tripartite-type tricarboxylate transporter receptor subunit TctC
MGAPALLAVSRIARAQAYPARPVRLVVGFPAGGTNDIHARLIADWLSKQFARSFIVENRPGAAGNIALESVVRTAPDGYTLSLCGSTELRNEILYNDLKFSFMHDTAPVASIMLAMNVLVVHPASSIQSVPELIAAAKANPDAMTVASSGPGSTPLGTVQEHDGNTHVARALSRWGAGSDGSTWPTGAGLLRHDRGCDGTHQGGPIACACSNRRNTHTSVARRSDHR